MVADVNSVTIFDWRLVIGGREEEDDDRQRKDKEREKNSNNNDDGQVMFLECK